MSLDHFPRNPDYGRGIYRRRIRITGEAGNITAILNDDFHCMWARLHHDGRTVVATDGELLRYPKTTCPGAAHALDEIAGTPLDIGRSAFFGNGRTSRNCTHLLDLALLMLRHAYLGTRSWIIDLSVSDSVGGVQRLQASVDGRPVHDWTLEDGRIASPQPFAGQAILSGFSRWADATFSGDALDGARMLQKAAFVARGRQYIVDHHPLQRASAEPTRIGDCYSFSEPRFTAAVAMPHYVIDFTAGLIETIPVIPATAAT